MINFKWIRERWAILVTAMWRFKMVSIRETDISGFHKELIWSFKKSIINLFLITLVLSACSSPEPIFDQPDIAVEEEIISPSPSWYEPAIPSSFDKIAFYGYALASSYDSTQASELSRENAIHNLRIEIDRFVEDARRSLDASEYETPAFIIRLRNAIRSIDLSGAEFEILTDYSDEGISHVYTKAFVRIDYALQQLAYHLNDTFFVDQMFAMD